MFTKKMFSENCFLGAVFFPIHQKMLIHP